MHDIPPCRSPYRFPSDTLHRRHWLCSGLALAGLLAGCAAKPVETGLSVVLAAGPDTNPDARGRASPLAVRLYVLRSTAAFEGADFFSLYERDAATLGPEMLRRDELLLRPGEGQTLALKLPPEARAIGVVAAFRDLDRARWRAVQAVSPAQSQTLSVGFGARQVRIEAK